ncbi:extracellular calcium-sensing receptor-like [Protopterus annectens]|uniref:extracellular calcium-sensing receptor-like n=1 Tax=Protopterus annectens TaxID=7888 RepID=UPI001CFAF4FF|nr:extracellular calcium-sensing receptor-like [Protopterus annectens]
MIFAVKEINRDSKLLPNVSLGFWIVDSCFSRERALLGTLMFLTGSQVPVPNYDCNLNSLLPAIIGDGPSSSSLTMATVLGLYKFPQVSYGSSISLLSDKLMFPAFMRTVPNDEVHAIGMAHLLIHFGWTWVGILASDNDYGMLGSQTLKKEIAKAGGCIAFTEMVTKDKAKIPSIINVIQQSTANVIVIYCTTENIVPMLEAISVHIILGRVWVIPAAWQISLQVLSRKVVKTLNGSIGFSVHKGKIPGLTDFLYSIQPSIFPSDIYTTMFWEEAFGCQWPVPGKNLTEANLPLVAKKPFCTGHEDIRSLDASVYDAYNFTYSLNTYNAVYAVAHSLHNILLCMDGQGPFLSGQCADIHHLQPWKLLHYAKNVHFNNSGDEEMYFDKNGDPPPRYDIFNFALFPDGTNRYVQLGLFDNEIQGKLELTISEGDILWNERFKQVPNSVCSKSCSHGYQKVSRRGQPICCFDCFLCSKGEISNQTDAVNCMKCSEDFWSNDKRDKCIPKHLEYLSYEDPLGQSLFCCSLAFSVMTVSILCNFLKFKDTPIVKANNRELSYLLLIALVLCFLCSLLFIGQPAKLSCMFHQVIFGLTFSLCVSCVLAKTVMVVLAFNATKPGSRLRSWVGPKVSNSIVISGFLIQVIICCAWLSVSAPFPEFNKTAEDGKIIIGCNEGSIFAFWIMLGYLGLLAVVSFVVAFLARNLPGSFNEAKYITFSMLVFVSVWLSFIPAYLSTRGMYMVAVEIFAILASSAGMLVCIFLPKCYIIILRPKMNTREYMVGKGDSLK